MDKIKFSKVRDVKSPTRGTGLSAGIDFYVPRDKYRWDIPPHTDILIPSGIKINLLDGFRTWALIAYNKSGVATSRLACERAGKTPKATAKNGSLIVGACVVDKDYQGEIHIHLINTSDEYIYLVPDEKIAQFIIMPVYMNELEEVPEAELFSCVSERGTGGFGSSDKLK